MHNTRPVRLSLMILCLLLALSGCGGGGGFSDSLDVFQAAGADAAAIQAQVDQFRAALGADNGVGAASVSGRRQVNWDGIPAARLDPFPGDFFVTTSPRGIEFSTPGSRMKVSGDPGTPSFKFADITAQQWGLTEFGFFSPSRLFGTLGSNITDVRFRVPGTAAPATVLAFGTVLVDVDVADATRIEFYGADDRLLATRTVQPTGVASQGLAFIGVIVRGSGRIGRVRIIAGTKPIDSPFANPPPDGVGIDDVIYSEPQPVGQ